MRALVDTGFWYSFLGTGTEDHHERALEIFHFLEKQHAEILVPFPTLYEAVNTKLLRNKNKRSADWFLEKLTKEEFIKVPDDKYRDEAFGCTLKYRDRGISLVDSILRVMIEQESERIDVLITFNISDFIDVCNKNKVNWISLEGESFNI